MISPVTMKTVALTQRNMRTILLTWLVLIMPALTAHADAALVAKIENAIRGAEPGWRCTKGILDAPPPPVASERPLIVSVWDHKSENGRGESVDVNVFKVDSLSDAKISLGPAREGKVHTGWKIETFKIGDEGYLGTFKNSERFAITFRKGTIVVRISSDSLPLAQRFAQHVAAQIDTPDIN